MDTSTAPAGDAAITPASETAPVTSLLEASPSSEPSAPAASAEKPEWLPDNFWREGQADYQALAKSYRGMQEILGRKSQSVLVPNEKSKPEEIAEFRKALGVPESPDDYLKSLKPEALPEGVQFDEAMAKQAAQLAHKHNIPPAAMKELAALQIGQVQAMAQASEQMVIQQLQAGKEQLQSEYGDKFGEKLDLAKRAAITAGIDPTARGFADPAMVKLAVWAAEQIAEDKLVSANASPMQVGKDRALDIIANPENPLHRRYQEGDEDVVRQVRSYLSQR
jgi:hypothetical protein